MKMTKSLAHQHYVPVLRWKSGEIKALTNLINQGTDLSGLTPLVEPVPGRLSRLINGSNKAQIEVLAKEISKYCGQNRTIYLDLVQIPPALCNLTGHHILTYLGNKPLFWSMFVPVTGLQREPQYQGAIRNVIRTQFVHSHEQYKRLGLRLTPSELMARNVDKVISLLLKDLNITRDDVDLIIDFGWLETSPYNYAEIFAGVPTKEEWRSVVLIGGNWPEDLTGYKATDVYDLARPEWEQWLSIVSATKPGERFPTFGDYTVRHAIYKEKDTKVNVSASVRYTCRNKYLIFRGEWTEKAGGLGFDQYLGFANLLVGRQEYAGEAFSSGDRFIKDKSNALKQPDKRPRKPGSHPDWIEASVNHHLTLVLDQLANLSVP